MVPRTNAFYFDNLLLFTRLICLGDKIILELLDSACFSTFSCPFVSYKDQLLFQWNYYIFSHYRIKINFFIEYSTK